MTVWRWHTQFRPPGLTRTGCMALLLASLLGCRPWVGGRLFPDPDPPAAAKPEATVSPKPPVALAQDIWIRTYQRPGIDTGPPEFRWHSPAIDELLAQPPTQQPDFRALLTSDQKVVATNAAIVLARRGDASGRDRLVAAARATELKLPLRRAAIEALANLPDESSLASLHELLTAYGRFDGSVPYQGELHAELLIATSTHVALADEPAFTLAAKSPSPDVRLTVLDCWSRASSGQLPTPVADLRGDPKEQVRAAALRAAAARRHPQALEWARAALGDYSLDVRVAAIGALGEIEGPDALETLEPLLKEESEILRCAAMFALDRHRADKLVRQGATDKSWRVRKIVAESLARQRPEDALPLARAMLDDASAEVQREVVRSFEHWPLEDAGPLLLEALDKSVYLPRKEAGQQLARRWPPAEAYSIDLPADRRQEVVMKLNQQWRAEHHAIEPAAANVAKSPTPVTPAPLDEVEHWLTRLRGAGEGEQERQAIVARLRDYGPSLPPALERLRFERNVAIPAVVFHEVLRPLDERYQVLDALASDDVSQRRRAAARIARLNEEQPLDPLILDRIAELGSRDSDELVCRWLLESLQGDRTGQGRRLAHALASHPADEIRRVACEQLAVETTHEDVPVLLPALADRYPPVVRAAVRGLSRPKLLPSAAALEKLLDTPDKSTRLEVAAALARMGAESGPPAIERLAHDTDGEIRRQAAEAMGRQADPLYTAELVRMLDDPVARRAALESLPRTAGRDVIPADEAASLSLVEKIDRWKRWWASEASAGQIQPIQRR